MMMYMRFPENRQKALTFSYDDGAYQDRRLIEIFNKYGLHGTFNLNASSLFSDSHFTPEEAREVFGGKMGKNHEVAIHTYTHPFLDRIPREMAVYEVIKDREKLEDFFGRIVRGCAYPMGTYNDMTVEVLRNCGICYARTIHPTYSFDIPTDWLRMPVTCHHNHEGVFDIADKFLNESPNHHNSPWLFYVWGHSFEFDHQNNWDRIERLAEKLSGRDDVWYATNIEIYDYVEAYRALHFSVEGKIVYNPSAIPVWFNYSGIDVKVNPGESVKFR